jgi:hypothetical protein
MRFENKFLFEPFRVLSGQVLGFEDDMVPHIFMGIKTSKVQLATKIKPPGYAASLTTTDGRFNTVNEGSARDVGSNLIHPDMLHV